MIALRLFLAALQDRLESRIGIETLTQLLSSNKPDVCLPDCHYSAEFEASNNAGPKRGEKRVCGGRRTRSGRGEECSIAPCRLGVAPAETETSLNNEAACSKVCTVRWISFGLRSQCIIHRSASNLFYSRILATGARISWCAWMRLCGMTFFPDARGNRFSGEKLFAPSNPISPSGVFTDDPDFVATMETFLRCLKFPRIMESSAGLANNQNTLDPGPSIRANSRLKNDQVRRNQIEPILSLKAKKEGSL